MEAWRACVGVTPAHTAGGDVLALLASSAVLRVDGGLVSQMRHQPLLHYSPPSTGSGLDTTPNIALAALPTAIFRPAGAERKVGECEGSAPCRHSELAVLLGARTIERNERKLDGPEAHAHSVVDER